MYSLFVILASLTLLSAVAALSLRNLVHCALCLVVAFGGLAVLYLILGAQFVGFAQLLVYVGAVAIIIVFAILLTRNQEANSEPMLSGSWSIGLGVALMVLGTLVFSVLNSSAADRSLPPPPAAGVRLLGDRLLREYVLPLEVVGLLLTAAMIGAVLLALREPEGKRP